MKKELILDNRVFPLTFSCHAIKVDHMVYTPGIVSVDAKGNIVGKEDIKAQVTQVFENIKNTLGLVGASFENVVKSTFFTTDAKYFPEIMKVRSRYINNFSITSTGVVVKELAHPDYLFEMEIIAVVD